MTSHPSLSSAPEFSRRGFLLAWIFAKGIVPLRASGEPARGGCCTPRQDRRLPLSRVGFILAIY